MQAGARRGEPKKWVMEVQTRRNFTLYCFQVVHAVRSMAGSVLSSAAGHLRLFCKTFLAFPVTLARKLRCAGLGL